MGRKKAGTTNGIVELPVGSSQDTPEKVAHVAAILLIANSAIGNAVKRQHPEIALAYIKDTFNNRHISDISAIQACYETQRRWTEFNIDGNFIDYVETEIGKGAETIRRYAKIGKMLNEVTPEEFRQTLWCRPIRNLVAIAQAVDEHGDFTKDQWHKLAMCVNGQEVRMRLGEFLEKERKPTNRLVITMDRDGGLRASRRGKSEPIGMLVLDETNPLVAEAVQRIIASAGILEM